MSPDLIGAFGSALGNAANTAGYPPWRILSHFHVDHIIARQHGGGTELENLALACLHCNRHKGPNMAGWDSATRKLVRLFHPIRVLAIDDPDFLAVRQALIEEQAFQRTDDDRGDPDYHPCDEQHRTYERVMTFCA